MSTESKTPFLFGPVQMLVLGFAEDEFTGKIMAELRRLKEADVVRLIDLMVVAKDEDGNIETRQISDLSHEESIEFGAMIGALLGLGAGLDDEDVERAAIAGATEMDDGHMFDEAEVWYVADAIPAGSAAAIALIEHRWAIPLRDKIFEAGGVPLVDEWIHPTDLIAAGAAAREKGAVSA